MQNKRYRLMDLCGCWTWLLLNEELLSNAKPVFSAYAMKSKFSQAIRLTQQLLIKSLEFLCHWKSYSALVIRFLRHWVFGLQKIYLGLYQKPRSKRQRPRLRNSQSLVSRALKVHYSFTTFAYLSLGNFRLIVKGLFCIICSALDNSATALSWKELGSCSTRIYFSKIFFYCGCSAERWIRQTKMKRLNFRGKLFSSLLFIKPTSGKH